MVISSGKTLFCCSWCWAWFIVVKGADGAVAAGVAGGGGVESEGSKGGGAWVSKSWGWHDL